MLKAVEGDILKTRAQVIVQGLAPDDHFNQGLAKSLRELYPSLAKDFRHFCQVSSPKPGELFFWGSADGKRIVNLLTQEPAPNKRGNPGKATTRNVNRALHNLKVLIEKESFTSVALPRLATGVGGLDWSEVSTLIENQLGDLDLPIYVYEVYQPGVQAAE